MEAKLRKDVLAMLEELLAEDWPPEIMAHRICVDVVEPLLEQETNTWKALAYAVPC